MKSIYTVIVSICIIVIFTACASLIKMDVSRPTPVVQVDMTPERLVRGEYLANNVMFCITCHSERNWDYFAGPIIPGTEGKGGYEIQEMFGTIYTTNITSYELGSWTDGELIQAITEGMNKSKQALFPIMPSGRYRYMDEEDIYSVVAYIRTLPSIPSEFPEKRLKFPFKHIERTFPKPWEPEPHPDPSDQGAYGRYLATIGDCISCHTPMTKSGKYLEGMDLAGGAEFPLHDGTMINSPNITPDDETGIGNWSEEDFIENFKQYGTAEGQSIKVPNNRNTVMPWIAYSGMTEDDLAAIYAFLRSVNPVVNDIEVYPMEDNP